MTEAPLTGKQKSFLRGLGQRLPARLKIGKSGATTAFCTELAALLRADELVKVRFAAGDDRDKRAALCVEIADKVHCACVGAVGHTAVFFRPWAEGKDGAIQLPARI